MGQLANTPDPAPENPGGEVDPNTITPPAEPELTRVEAMAADLAELTGADTPDPYAPPADPPAGDPPPAAAPDGATEYLEIGGMRIPKDQEQAVANLLEWASGLTEEQAALAFAAANPTPPPAPAPATPPAPAPAPDEFAIPQELIDTYPEVAAVLQRQQEALAALKAEVDPRLEQVESITGQQAYEATQTTIAETETKVREDFLKAKSLTEADYAELVTAAGNLGIVPSLVESLGLEAGFTRALEVAYNSDPKMVEREVRRMAQSAQTAGRKERASALSPSGGSTPRTTPDPQNLPVSEKRRAMVDDINRLMGQN